MVYLFDRPVSLTGVSSKEVRDNFNAIGTLNYTESESTPENPRDGMPRILASDPTNIRLQIYYDGAWLTLLEHVEIGAAPRRLEFDFDPAVDVWVCNHNLGREPNVQAFNENNRLVVPQEILHSSLNRVVITHSIPVRGKAILVG